MRIRSANDFGTIARQRRRDLKISQQELADRAGVTRQWLVRFEKGNTEVTLSKAFGVLRELDLTVRANPADSSEFTVSMPKQGFVIPKVELPEIDAAALQQSLTKMRGISNETLLSEVREKIATINALNQKALRAKND